MGNAVVKSTPLLVPERRSDRSGVKAEVLADVLDYRAGSRVFSFVNSITVYTDGFCLSFKSEDLGPASLTLLADNSTLTSDITKKLRAVKGEYVYWDLLGLEYPRSGASCPRFLNGRRVPTMTRKLALAVAGITP